MQHRKKTATWARSAQASDATERTITSRKPPARDLLATNTKRKKLTPTRSWGPQRRQRQQLRQQRMQYLIRGVQFAGMALLILSFGFHGRKQHQNSRGAKLALLPRLQLMWWSVTHRSFDPSAYRSPQEQEDRRLRFPTIEDRVKLYMSNWYVPACPGNSAGKVPFAVVDVSPTHPEIPPMLSKAAAAEDVEDLTNSSDATMDATKAPIVMQQTIAKEINGYDPNRQGIYIFQDNIVMAQLIAIRPEKARHCTDNEYCPDTIDYLLPSLDRVDREKKTEERAMTTIAQFGDSSTVRGYNRDTLKWDPFPSVPHLMKFRFAFLDPNAIAAMTANDCIAGDRNIYYTLDSVNAAKFSDYYQPIVWKFTSLRHLSMIPGIADYDIPFEQKKDMAVFRGALTGIFRDGYKAHMKGKITDEEKCRLIHRCKLVYQNSQSKLVDALLVHAKQKKGTQPEIPNKIGGVSVYGSKFSYDQMLQYKAIIMLEGNDISSGLKWALYSNSVVMTQQPTKTSWAMEELLEPWVHYVPLNSDLSDVEEKMQWIVDNPSEAKQIAYRGSLWIRDLLLHPDSLADDEIIYDEMIRRYRAHFVYNPDLESV